VTEAPLAVSLAQKAAQDTGAWPRFWPVLVTAAITLLATVWVQLYVIPRVETRKRRDDRWERDVLALGELLTFEQPAAASALAHALDWKAVLSNQLDDLHEGALATLREKNEQEIRDCQDEYGRMDARVDWLIDQVQSIDRRADRLKPFTRAAMSYRASYIRLIVFSHMPVEDDEFTEEQITAAAGKERTAVRAMVSALKSLLGHPPPTTRLRKRLTKRWLRLNWMAPLLRWRATRAAKRDGGTQP
jgi:hypothetical protein